jgi:hypothetical protein
MASGWGSTGVRVRTEWAQSSIVVGHADHSQRTSLVFPVKGSRLPARLHIPDPASSSAATPTDLLVTLRAVETDSNRRRSRLS